MTAPDVVVVGGGPAGTSTATHLARNGWQVLLLERHSYPRDKPCGDGLSPRALAALSSFGLDEGAAFHTVAGVRVRAGSRSVEIGWPPESATPGMGWVARRTDLDGRLADAARGAGVEVWERAEAEPLVTMRETLSVVAKNGTSRRVLSPKMVVVADGWPSRFARALGVRTPPGRPLGMALRGYVPSDRCEDRYLEFHLDVLDQSDRVIPGYGWIFPVGDGTVNLGVAALTTAGRWRGLPLRRLLHRFAANIGGEWQLGPLGGVQLRGGGLPEGLVSPSFGSNWVLVGDAVGAVNPFTGEGISYALETGELAAEAVHEALAAADSRRLAGYGTRLLLRYGRYQSWGRRFLALVAAPGWQDRLSHFGLAHRRLASTLVGFASGPSRR